MKDTSNRSKAYKVFSMIVLIILALLFLFPLYWIVTGAFKTGQDIYATTPAWLPSQWTMDNFAKLFDRRSAPLFEIGALVGPTVPGAIRWLVNTVFMAVAAMLLTCITAAMAGYALAKKRFIGRAILFSLIVCAMALPKQVILIPLLKETGDFLYAGREAAPDRRETLLVCIRCTRRNVQRGLPKMRRFFRENLVYPLCKTGKIR